jgi:N-hydroxyarylamine O-acetyltransferase
VASVPYENLDVRLGREIRLDLASLVAKIVDRRRGGYCYEQNTLFAGVLEAAGWTVTRCLGRVRLGDPVSPRPATHMVLLVDGQVVDVGFGSANPLGPIPLGGSATHGPWTWSTEPARSPEGEDVWEVHLHGPPPDPAGAPFDLTLYSFTEAPQHPVDYLAPNHFSATHALSIFTQHTIVQRWDGVVQIGIVDRLLTERRADGSVHEVGLEPGELGRLLAERFGLSLGQDELDVLSAAP